MKLKKHYIGVIITFFIFIFLGYILYANWKPYPTQQYFKKYNITVDGTYSQMPYEEYEKALNNKPESSTKEKLKKVGTRKKDTIELSPYDCLFIYLYFPCPEDISEEDIEYGLNSLFGETVTADYTGGGTFSISTPSEITFGPTSE